MEGVGCPDRSAPSMICDYSTVVDNPTTAAGLWEAIRDDYTAKPVPRNYPERSSPPDDGSAGNVS
jgi:hypothetical protein